MKQRMIKAGILLFVLMIFFTILSRAAYNQNTAEVSTENPGPQTFSPEVSAQGTVAGSRETAVSAVENLRVGTVHVVAGQTVEAGEVLFEIDLQDLAEKMQEKQLELRSLDLQIQSAAESAALAEESRQLNLSQVQEDYNRTAARENAAVDEALVALRQAQEEYQNFVAGTGGGQMGHEQSIAGQMEDRFVDSDQIGFGQTDSGQLDSSQMAETLRVAVEEKQAAYDQALRGREESLYQAQKAVDSAGLGTVKDYSVEQSQITRGQKEAELVRLQALMDVQGRVASPTRGLVVGVSVSVGGTTTGGADILLSDTSDGASLSVTFPEELRTFVREGQQAVVTASAATGSNPFSPQAASERVTIRTVADNGVGNMASGMETAVLSGGITGGTSGGSFTVMVNLSPEHFTVGEMVTLRVEAQTSKYDTCVPAGAVHLAGREQYYVNVAEKRSTILGEEWVVRKVDVELLDKDGKYAAVKGISQEQEIVTESSRTLEEGSRVKLKNEE